MLPPGLGSLVRRRVAAAMVVVGVLPLVAACTTTVDSASPNGAAAVRSAGTSEQGARDAWRGNVDLPRTVAVVGDSITVSSQSQLTEHLRALGLEVVAVDAQVGRRMTVGERDRLRAGAWVIPGIVDEHAPELWIVALGTNDIAQYPDDAAVAEQVRELLARIPAEAPLVWVDTWFRDRPEQTAIVNRAIRDTVAERPGATVVAWSDHAADDGVLTGDGVHLTETVGTSRFATVVAAGVRDHVGFDARRADGPGQEPQRD